MTITTKRQNSRLPSVRANVSRLISGFSLVELLIVVAVTSLSAAVTVPIYSTNITKAAQTEADANLGSIRTELRIYYGNNNQYPIAESPALVIDAAWNDIGEGQLSGKYFDDAAYTYLSSEGVEFTIVCSTKDELGSIRVIDETGTLSWGNQ